MLPLIVLNEILSPLTNIFKGNILLLSETFYDPKEKKDLLKLQNIL